MRAGAGADADTVVRLCPRGPQKPLSLLGAEEQGRAGAGPARGGCWGHGWGTLPGGVAAVQRGPLRCPELDAPQGWFGVPVASVLTCHLKAVIRASASWPSASPLASPTGPHEPQALTRQAPAVRLCACACTRARQPRASLHPWGLAQGPPARGTRRGRGGSRWPEAPRQRPPWCGALCVRLWPGTGAGRATPSRSRRKGGGPGLRPGQSGRPAGCPGQARWAAASARAPPGSSASDSPPSGSRQHGGATPQRTPTRPPGKSTCGSRPGATLCRPPAPSPRSPPW